MEGGGRGWRNRQNQQIFSRVGKGDLISKVIVLNMLNICKIKSVKLVIIALENGGGIFSGDIFFLFYLKYEEHANCEMYGLSSGKYTLIAC